MQTVTSVSKCIAWLILLGNNCLRFLGRYFELLLFCFVSCSHKLIKYFTVFEVPKLRQIGSSLGGFEK